MTLQEIVDAIDSLSAADRDQLFEIIHQRQIDDIEDKILTSRQNKQLVLRQQGLRYLY